MTGAGQTHVGQIRRKRNTLSRTFSTASGAKHTLEQQDVRQRRFRTPRGSDGALDSCDGSIASLPARSSALENDSRYMARLAASTSTGVGRTRSADSPSDVQSHTSHTKSSSRHEPAETSGHLPDLKEEQSYHHLPDAGLRQERDAGSTTSLAYENKSTVVFEEGSGYESNDDLEVDFRPWADGDVDQFTKALTAAHMMKPADVATTRVVVRLATTMYGFFIPSFVVAKNMPEVCKAVGIDNIDFRFDPSGLTATVGHISTFIPVSTNFHIANAAAVEKICEALIAHDLTVEEADREIGRISNRGGLYPPWLRACAWGVQTAGLSAIIFKSTVTGIWLSGIIGLFEGLFEEYLKRDKHPHVAMLEIYICGVLSSIVLLACHGAGWLDCPSMPYLSIMAIHLPGTMATFGVMEMLTGHTVCGASRFTSSMITANLIAMGYTTAGWIIKWLYVDILGTYMDPAQCPTSDAMTWWGWLVFVAVALCLSILLDTHLFQMPFSGPLLMISYMAFEVLGNYTEAPDDMIILINTIVLQVAAAAMKWSFFTSKTAILEPSIMILVPGSLMVRSLLYEGTEQQVLSIQLSTAISRITLSIAVGLMIGGMIVSCVVKSIEQLHTKRASLRTRKAVRQKERTRLKPRRHKANVPHDDYAERGMYSESGRTRIQSESGIPDEERLELQDMAAEEGSHEAVTEGDHDDDKQPLKKKLSVLIKDIREELKDTAPNTQIIMDDRKQAAEDEQAANSVNEDPEANGTAQQHNQEESLRHRIRGNIGIGFSSRGRLDSVTDFAKARRNTRHLTMV